MIQEHFHYLGDVISCGGGVESAVRDRRLVSLLVNHSIPLEERAKVYCACERPALPYAEETWTLMVRLEGLLASYDHKMLRYMSRARWQDRIIDEDVRRRYGVENLEYIFKENEIEMVWSCKR